MVGIPKYEDSINMKICVIKDKTKKTTPKGWLRLSYGHLTCIDSVPASHHALSKDKNKRWSRSELD